ncbi:ribosome-associated protein [Aestuariibacter sp. AA17]|uniref:Dual-action ribosomal maturation protein DarP n=1 Tax=Fluctibacter corallii TaxID=2984329 RepID=A0ABT3AB08_9ALTE|nr:ribosome biogenesis factor YjgA [Aestuariibacter sp. AA17]MCV2885767.1 ribosome-associated protein [Aestuariibacter sp. AA17]
MTDTDFEIDQQEPEFKSKTQIKQEAHALQKLGEELVKLGSAALAKIPMDDELEEAVELARKINKKKDGYRRQLQFIGKLLRQRDVAPIEQALAELQASSQLANKAFHKIEQTRDTLLTQGDDAIQPLLVEYPDLDRQKLRQLVRMAKKQKEQNKPPKAARELFQYLKDAMQD